MSKAVLNILSTSYRATLEEQDDTVLWLSQTLRANGAEIDIFLRGSCVNYALKNASKPQLVIADWKQSHPADIGMALQHLYRLGAKLYYLEEDAQEMGVAHDEMLSFIEPVTARNMPSLFAHYRYIWQW